MKVFGLWERLTKIVFFKGKQVAIDPATQTGAADKVISIPDMAASATQEMVLTAQAQTLTNKTISGADNTLQAIPGASLNNDSVTASKLDPTTVAGLGLVMTDTGAGVDRLDVNPDGSTLEINADALRIKDSGVTEAKIQTGAVTADKIGSNAVTAAKLNADVAGAGLVLGTGNALEVLPDNITLALNGDTVQVKAQGVDTAQLKDSAVTNAKIANATIELGKMAADAANQQKVLKRQVTTGAVISGNAIPDSGTVLTDSAVNNNVVLKTLDRLQNYSTQVSITGASTELFVNNRVGVVEILACASGTINQIMVENTDAAHLVILNRTGAPILIDNDVGTSASRRIITGTGGPVNLADKAALFLVYNANQAGALNRWTVVGGTGGGAGGTVTQVTTAAPHGFTNASDKGKVLYLNGSTYTAAIATAANTAEVVGILANVIDSDTFELATGGAVEVIEGNDFEGGSVPAIGEAVFLSASEAGKMTAVEPTTVGHVSKPLGVIFASNKMFFYNMRGTVVGGANLRTQIGLANNTTTNIQNITGYRSGEIAGDVFIDATADYKFGIKAQFVKDAAGAWKVSFQTWGDTPPQGFKVDATTVASVDYLQVTMPNVAGFDAATSNINFALNAPAVGTSLPLQINSSNITWQSDQTFRNRIINGDMRIDQRYAGAATTPSSGATYIVDRFAVECSFASKLTFRQVSNVSTDTNYEAGAAPSGFTHSLKISVASSYTPTAAENSGLFQQIEGFNIADLAWGTANAKPITISFWVKGSITGKYTIHVRNTGETRTFLTTITINAANTWEYKTITVPGCTDGTWLVNNQRGILVSINLGAGANFKGTTGSWLTTSGTPKLQSSDSIDFVSQINGSTLYMTGVQLEAGPIATPFERRLFQTELALCQRYYEKSYDINVAPGTITTNGVARVHGQASSNYLGVYVCFKQTKQRSNGTATVYHSGTGAVGSWSADAATVPTLVTSIGSGGMMINANNTTIGTNVFYSGHWTIETEL